MENKNDTKLWRASEVMTNILYLELKLKTGVFFICWDLLQYYVISPCFYLLLPLRGAHFVRVYKRVCRN